MSPGVYQGVEYDEVACQTVDGHMSVRRGGFGALSRSLVGCWIVFLNSARITGRILLNKDIEEE